MVLLQTLKLLMPDSFAVSMSPAGLALAWLRTVALMGVWAVAVTMACAMPALLVCW